MQKQTDISPYLYTLHWLLILYIANHIYFAYLGKRVHHNKKQVNIALYLCRFNMVLKNVYTIFIILVAPNDLNFPDKCFILNMNAVLKYFPLYI